MNERTFQAFSKELQKIATIPGLSLGKSPIAGASLGKLRNGGVRPPTVPKVGVTAPKV